jgi:Na+/proline symporter
MIVALEWLLGGLTGLYCLMFVVFGFYGLFHLNFPRVFSSMGIAIVMAAIAAAAFFGGTGLRRGRRWAWITSWCIGIVVMLFGWHTIHEGLYGAGPDGGFGLIIGPVLVLCALLGIVLLVLPQTRRYCDPVQNLDDSRQPLL